ncbi:MAG: hypothetical protein U0269_37060 [Polyangiales bacterium]
MTTANKPKRPANKPPAPSKPARATFDSKLSAARRAYSALLAELEDASRDELRGWDRKWEAVATVLEKKLFVLDDEAPTAAEWIKKHTQDEYRTGLRNARVAKLASPDEEKKYTVTKIDLAYSIDQANKLAAAKKKGIEWSPPATPAKLDLAKLRYTIVRDGASVRVGLDEISVAELRALNKRESSVHDSSRARLSATTKRVARAVNSQKGLENITFSERDNELTIGRVRKDQLHALADALRKVSAEDE